MAIAATWFRPSSYVLFWKTRSRHLLEPKVLIGAQFNGDAVREEVEGNFDLVPCQVALGTRFVL
jgi:hypothetical protein